MNKLIYDTNVYYQIAKGETPSFLGNGVPIVATYNNIEEVSISHNILNNLDLLKETIQAIFNNYDSLIIENPIEYTIKLTAFKALQRNIVNPSFQSNHNLTSSLDWTTYLPHIAIFLFRNQIQF